MDGWMNESMNESMNGSVAADSIQFFFSMMTDLLSVSLRWDKFQTKRNSNIQNKIMVVMLLIRRQNQIQNFP